MKSKLSSKHIIIAIIVCLALAAGFFALKDSGSGERDRASGKEVIDLPEVVVTASKLDAAGIDKESEFIVKSQGDLPEKLVRENLKITPEIAYELKKVKADHEYRVVPKEELKENVVYNLYFDNTGKDSAKYTWAFQSKGEFKVLGTLPADRSNGVPVNSGIEIRFPYENIDLDSVDEYFEITPDVQGNFEIHQKSLTFVHEDFEKSTMYTVKLKKGLPLENSDEKLMEDYVFSFETKGEEEESQGFSFGIDSWIKEIPVNEAPVFKAYFYDEEEIPSVHINLYTFSGSDEYIQSIGKREQIPYWAYEARRTYKEDLSELEKKAEYDTVFISVDRYEHYIEFPSSLEPGFYLAEIKAGDSDAQVCFMVTDLAVYVAEGLGHTLVWVNDLESRKPAVGAAIKVNNADLKGKTDKKGVAYLETKGLEEKRAYLIIEGNGKQCVAPLKRENLADEYWHKEDISDSFWKYIYLDRELYKPNDKVNFWGVVSSREAGRKAPSEITIELQNPYDWDRPLMSQKVGVEGNTFEGEIKLPTLRPGYYYLNVKIGDSQISSRGFSVETYKKASYRVSLEPMKRAIFAGEEVDLLAKASFFEGTPVPNLDLKFYGGGEGERNVTTGKSGEVIIRYIGKGDSYYSPSHEYLGIYAKTPEYGDISTHNNIYVFKSKYHIEGDSSFKAGKLELDLDVRRVDLKDINSGKTMIKENYLREGVSNTPVKLDLFEEVWTKEEIGQEYDFIEKKVRKIYRSEYSKKLIKTIELMTDSEGKVEYAGNLDPEKSYYLEAKVYDDQQREDKTSFYLRDGFYVDPYDGYKEYRLKAKDEVDKYYDRSYDIGEEVELTFIENDNALDARDSSFLYMSMKKDIEDYEVKDGPEFSFEFTESDIPNINIKAVYFDGRSFKTTPYSIAAFDEENKKLNIEVKKDKKEYNPKDKVKLEIIVTDKDGKPVQAEVNVNLVDEALYALMEQRVDILSDIYIDYIYTYVNEYVSHLHYDYREGGAEGGGEGGGERQNFQDTVIFETVETGSDGKAEVEFELPDNLTSWRITAQAVTEGLDAGSKTESLEVRMPYFFELGLNDKYLSEDSPIFMIKSFGDELEENPSILYEVKLIDDEDKEILSKEIQGGKQEDIKIPKLEEGKYRFKVSAKYKGYEDSVIKGFEVVSSFLEREMTSQALLSGDIALRGGEDEPTLLVFSDYDKSQYIDGLYNLVYGNSSRIEQLLAKNEARRLLKSYLGEENFYLGGVEDTDFVDYQNYDGGIKILPYSESDLELTAMVAMYKPEGFNYPMMREYLYGVLQDEERDDLDKSIALKGLGAMKEPVLNSINYYLQKEDISPEVMLNLNLALVEIGNGAYADKVFDELFEKFGEEMETVARINQDEIIKATAEMAVLAEKLDKPQKNKLYQYLIENPGEEILTSMDQLEILKERLKHMTTKEVSFKYELDGEMILVELDKGQVYRIEILPEDIEKIKFSQIEGRVGVMSMYSALYDEEKIEERDDLSVSRKYLVDGKETTVFNRYDLVKVEIEYDIEDDAPKGYHEIIDTLPACFAYVDRPYRDYYDRNSYLDYPNLVKDQTLNFRVWRERGKIHFYVRVVTPGEFTAQPTLLSNSNNPSVCVLGEENWIEVK